MVHEGKIIHAVFGLGKIRIIFYRLAENAAVNFFQGSIADKISLQICLKEEFFIGILCVQVGAEQVVQLVGFQLSRRVDEHYAGYRAVGGDFFQLLHKARLLPSGKIVILNQLLIDQIQLIHGRFLTQGEIGNHHIIGMGQVKNSIQKMGFALPVFAADYHAGGFSLFGGQVQTI